MTQAWILILVLGRANAPSAAGTHSFPLGFASFGKYCYFPQVLWCFSNRCYSPRTNSVSSHRSLPLNCTTCQSASFPIYPLPSCHFSPWEATARNGDKMLGHYALRPTSCLPTHRGPKRNLCCHHLKTLHAPTPPSLLQSLLAMSPSDKNRTTACPTPPTSEALLPPEILPPQSLFLPGKTLS